MGIVYTALKQYHTALQSHNQSLDLEPHFGGSYFWRGETYFELQLYVSAFGDYSQALYLLPTMGGADEVKLKISFCYSQMLSFRLSSF
jgi:tetratricopeptide (TPR) repeat protein